MVLLLSLFPLRLPLNPFSQNPTYFFHDQFKKVDFLRPCDQSYFPLLHAFLFLLLCSSHTFQNELFEDISQLLIVLIYIWKEKQQGRDRPAA